MPDPHHTTTPHTPTHNQPTQCLAEYIWIGGGSDLKSRTVVLDAKPSCAEELPIAEIDGSSFGLASEEQCEIYLQPRKVFPDPFRGGDHILVLCDTATMPLPPLPADGDSSSAASLEACWDAMQPHASNHRAACEGVMAQAADQQPLFSMQQEYSLYSNTCVSSGQAFFGGSALCGSGGLGSCMPGAAPVPIAGLPTGEGCWAAAVGQLAGWQSSPSACAAGLAAWFARPLFTTSPSPLLPATTCCAQACRPRRLRDWGVT